MLCTAWSTYAILKFKDCLFATSVQVERKDCILFLVLKVNFGVFQFLSELRLCNGNSVPLVKNSFLGIVGLLITKIIYVTYKLMPSENVLECKTSGGQLLKIWLLNNQLVITFGRKSTAWRKIFQLLKSS